MLMIVGQRPALAAGQLLLAGRASLHGDQGHDGIDVRRDPRILAALALGLGPGANLPTRLFVELTANAVVKAADNERAGSIAN